MLSAECRIPADSITVLPLTTQLHFQEYPIILADIMIEAWRSAFRGILHDDIIEQYTQYEDCVSMFAQILASGIGSMYLAQQNGQSLGLLYWLPETEKIVRIEALLTIPEAWGKGIGAALMTHALADMQSAGYTAVHIWPFAENIRAQRFYRKFGFTATGNTHQGDALELEYIRTFSVS